MKSEIKVHKRQNFVRIVFLSILFWGCVAGDLEKSTKNNVNEEGAKSNLNQGSKILVNHDLDTFNVLPISVSFNPFEYRLNTFSSFNFLLNEFPCKKS